MPRLGLETVVRDLKQSIKYYNAIYNHRCGGNYHAQSINVSKNQHNNTPEDPCQ